MSAPVDYAGLSLWHETAEQDWTPRPALVGDTDADVAIVGAGFTGLWTAYYLLAADPSLQVVVLESQVAGFGASGRNGGWCSALFPTGTAALARRYGLAAALGMHRAMTATVDEVGAVCALEGIEAHYRKSGTVVAARSEVQLARASAEVGTARELGLGHEDLLLLDAADATRRIGARRVLGATFTPHCARVHPARLVAGLARAVLAHGGRIYEQTPVTSIRPRTVRTTRGVVRARHVVRATEAYTAALPGQRRTVVPVYSLMVATEPLPRAFWARAGLDEHETFSDHRHLVVYGQRTADDRIAFGGRGAPYHLGSAVRPDFDRSPRVFTALRRTLVDMFPDLAAHSFTHAWGGPLSIPRDWMASVGLDRARGLAWAGGYVGDGVATSNLAGRTLADLLLGRDTELTRLPWVGHRSPRWEPEPARWLGVNAGLRLAAAADAEERLTRRPARLGRLLDRLTGGH